MKKILVSLFLCILLLFSCNSSFCSHEYTWQTEFGTYTFTKFPDNPYFFLFAGTHSSGICYFTIIFADNPLTVGKYNTFYSKDSSGTSHLYFYNPSAGGGDLNKHISSYLNTNFSSVAYSTDYYRLNDLSLSDKNFYTYTNHDIIDESSGEVVYKAPISFNAPCFRNKDDIQSLNFDKVIVDINDYDNKEDLYLHKLTVDLAVNIDNGDIIYDTSTLFDDNYIYYYNDTVIPLTFFTSFYFGGDGTDNKECYIIDKSYLELDNNEQYFLVLSSNSDNIAQSQGLYDYKKFDENFDCSHFSTSDTFSADELNKQMQQSQNNKLDEQNKKLDEQNKTSKGIWDTLKDLLSYINPLSENFFVYKLIELLVDAIKSLFIPSDGFFNDFFTNLKEWFSDRLGFLFYPFELLIDLLNRILNINLNEPTFSIPEVREPSTGNVLFYEKKFNFNDILLQNEAFETMHNIYFIIVDAIVVFGLVNLIKKKLEEVETK